MSEIARLRHAVSRVWEQPWAIPPRTFPLRPELEFVAELVCESTVDYQRLFKKYVARLLEQ